MKAKAGTLLGIGILAAVTVAAVAAAVPAQKVWWTQKTSTATEGGPTTCAQGLAVDKQGNVYYWGSDSSRLHRLSRSGAETVIAGVAPGVTAPYPADGAKATAVNLYTHHGGVAVDGKGDVFIAYESGPSDAVWKITPDGVMHLFAGGALPLGTDKTFPNGAAATSVPLNAIRDLAFDAHGNLFVAEPRAVIKITLAETASLAAGDPKNAVTGAHPSTSLLGDSVGCLAADRAGNVYVVDMGTVYSAGQSSGRVLKIAPSGTVTTFIPKDVAFSGITTDNQGRVYAQLRQTDGNSALRQYSPAGKLIATLAGGASTYRNRAPALGNFFGASNLAFDKSGNLLYVWTAGGGIYKLYLAPAPKKK